MIDVTAQVNDLRNQCQIRADEEERLSTKEPGDWIIIAVFVVGLIAGTILTFLGTLYALPALELTGKIISIGLVLGMACFFIGALISAPNRFVSFHPNYAASIELIDEDFVRHARLANLNLTPDNIVESHQTYLQNRPPND